MNIFSKFYTDEERSRLGNSLILINAKKIDLDILSRLLRRKDVGYVFIDDPSRIIDNITEGAKNTNKARHENEIGVFSYLDYICEVNNVVLFTTRQINPDGKDNPSSAYFSGSKEVARMADVIVILYTDNYKIEKSRAGQIYERMSWKEESDDQYDLIEKEDKNVRSL